MQSCINFYFYFDIKKLDLKVSIDNFIVVDLTYGILYNSTKRGDFHLANLIKKTQSFSTAFHSTNSNSSTDFNELA